MAVRVINTPSSVSVASTASTAITLHSNYTNGNVSTQQTMNGDSPTSNTTKVNNDTTSSDDKIGGTGRTSFRGMFFKDGPQKRSSSRRMIARVVPAEESSKGQLCVEMRIRLHEHGAMSKLLEQLADVSARPACVVDSQRFFNRC